MTCVVSLEPAKPIQMSVSSCYWSQVNYGTPRTQRYIWCLRSLNIWRLAVKQQDGVMTCKACCAHTQSWCAVVDREAAAVCHYLRFALAARLWRETLLRPAHLYNQADAGGGCPDNILEQQLLSMLHTSWYIHIHIPGARAVS